MSRGGLLLRALDAHLELAYVPVRGAILRGTRPPKLPTRLLDPEPESHCIRTDRSIWSNRPRDRDC
jgi:hypothetical protein